MMTKELSSVAIHKVLMTLPPYKMAFTEIERRKRITPNIEEYLTTRKGQKTRTALRNLILGICRVLRIEIEEREGKIDFVWLDKPRQRGPKRTILEFLQESDAKKINIALNKAFTTKDQQERRTHLCYVRAAVRILNELGFTDVDPYELTLKSIQSKKKSKTIKVEKEKQPVEERQQLSNHQQIAAPIGLTLEIFESYLKTGCAEKNKARPRARLRKTLSPACQYLGINKIDQDKESQVWTKIQSNLYIGEERVETEVELKSSITHTILTHPYLMLWSILGRGSIKAASANREISVLRLFYDWANEKKFRDASILPILKIRNESKSDARLPVVKSYLLRTKSLATDTERSNLLRFLFDSLQDASKEIDHVHEGFIWEEFLFNRNASEYSDADKSTLTWKLCYDQEAVLRATYSIPDDPRSQHLWGHEVKNFIEYINNLPKM